MLSWDYDEIEEFWFCGEPQNGCGVIKLINSKGAAEWWTRVVVNGVAEPWGPFKTSKEGKEKAQKEWDERSKAHNPYGYYGTI